MNETWIEIAVMTSQAVAEVIANRLMELGSQGRQRKIIQRSECLHD